MLKEEFLNSTEITTSSQSPFVGFYDKNSQLSKLPLASENEIQDLRQEMILDLNNIEDENFGSKIIAIGRKYGFIMFKNSGISQDLIAKPLYDNAKGFFKLALNEKKQSEYRDQPEIRGFYSFTDSGESAESAKFVDPKEWVYYGRENNPSDERLDNFNAEAINLFNTFEGILNKLIIKVSDGLEKALLDEAQKNSLTESDVEKNISTYLKAILNNGNHIMQLINYPGLHDTKEINEVLDEQIKLDLPGDRLYRSAPHTDLDALTLLIASEGSGLQILHSGKWYPLMPEAGMLVINFGDSFEKMTRGFLQSTIHRVVAPKEAAISEDANKQLKQRLSVPFFGQPKAEAILRPLVSEDFAKELKTKTRFNSENGYANDINFGDFLMKRLSDINPGIKA